MFTPVVTCETSTRKKNYARAMWTGNDNRVVYACSTDVHIGGPSTKLRISTSTSERKCMFTPGFSCACPCSCAYSYFTSVNQALFLGLPPFSILRDHWGFFIRRKLCFGCCQSYHIWRVDKSLAFVFLKYRSSSTTDIA